jgi:hypothetical protein
MSPPSREYPATENHAFKAHGKHYKGEAAYLEWMRNQPDIYAKLCARREKNGGGAETWITKQHACGFVVHGDRYKGIVPYLEFLEWKASHPKGEFARWLAR